MSDVSVRRTGRTPILAAAAVSLLAGMPVAGAAAEATVEATYHASLGGFSIASGSLSFALTGSGDYQAAIGAQVSGLASLVANRSAVASASGRAGGGSTSSRSYTLSINGGPIPNAVNMTFAGGSVASVAATELRPAGADLRVPVTAQHKRNVIDPLGAFVIAMPSAKDVLTPKVCARTLKVFDGRVRYDLRLVYGSRMDVRGEPGSYSGPAIVCAVNYRPIAGFRQMTPEQERYERNIEFSIWFVPVGATNVVIPLKVVIGTPMGLLVVAASRFEVKGTRTAEAGGKASAAAPADASVANGGPPIRDYNN